MVFFIQAISYATYDLKKLLVSHSRHGLNSKPFEYQTVLHHLNTTPVWYSDPHKEFHNNKKAWTFLNRNDSDPTVLIFTRICKSVCFFNLQHPN